MSYDIRIEPFRLGEADGKVEANKLAEEACEAYSAWERLRDLGGDGGTCEERAGARAHAFCECLDVIQATCNLLACMGATQADVDWAARAVHRRNEARGRYGEGSAS